MSGAVAGDDSATMRQIRDIFKGIFLKSKSLESKNKPVSWTSVCLFDEAGYYSRSEICTV